MEYLKNYIHYYLLLIFEGTVYDRWELDFNSYVTKDIHLSSSQDA